MSENTAKKYDPNMVRAYLKALTGTGEYSDAVTFQTFDDKGINKRLANIRHLRRATAFLDKLAITQQKGAGIFVMVNKGDGKGRSAANVVEVRALFIDLDGSPWEPAAEMLRPHIRVESSQGRYHLYWLVSDCSLDQFKPIQQAIAKKFNGDKTCVDLARVLRVPGFMHQKYEPVMTQLVEVNNLRRYTTQQILDGLQLDMGEVVAAPPTKSLAIIPELVVRPRYEFVDPDGVVLDLKEWAAKNAGFDITTAIHPQYRRGDIRKGKQDIVCPFEDQHTNQQEDSATFVSNASATHPSFTIHCCHAHCDGRDRLAYVLAMLQKGWVDYRPLFASTPAMIELVRPPKIYFPVYDVAADMEWSTLYHAEYRMALHLTILMWSTDDGTLPDDDRKIAKLLGLSVDEWLPVKESLLLDGWLAIVDGKLINSLVKREFDNAQAAYSVHLFRCGKGGKKSREQARLKKLLIPSDSSQS